MKKIVTAAVAVLVVFSAGSAFAGGFGKGCGPEGRFEGHRRGRMEQGFDRMRELPEEIQAKMKEMQSIQAEIRTELAKEKPDSAKARSLNEKVITLRKELSNYRFEQMLKDGGQKQGQAGKGQRENSELRTLRAEMFSEMSKEKVDTAKVRTLHSKIETLMEKEERARFEEVLKDPSQYLRRSQGPGRQAGPGGAGAGMRRPQGREFSQADKAKFEQIRALHEEMRTEMAKPQRDDAKLRELHGKIQKLHNEMSDQHFEEFLKASKRVQ